MSRTHRCPPIQPDLLVIGVDLAKEKHVAVASAADNRQEKPFSFPVSRVGFESFQEYGQKAATKLGAKSFVVAVEPTGHYGHTLVTWLLAREIPVYSVQPLQTSRAKELYDGTTRKTDPKDAAVVAALCRQGLAKPYRVMTGAFAELRVAAQQREQLVKRRSQVVNRLHRHVDVLFPEVRKLFPKIESATCLWVLGTVPTPSDVLKYPREELVAGLKRASRGQLGEKRAEQLIAAAKASVGVVEGLASHRLALTQLLEEFVGVLKQIATLERHMESALSQVSYAANLRTIPRLGMVTTATLLGELGDLRDYKVARQLVAMAGLSLVETSSGQRQGHLHISRRGRAYARQMLYLAALRVGWGVLAEPRRRKVEDRKGEATKAAVANMARLLRIMHAIARDGSTFDATRFTPKAEVLAA